MGRRGRGEGSIYQRRDGRWAAQVDLGWRGGKRQRKTIYGATRRAVAEELKRLQREQQQGLPVPDDRLTMQMFLERWLHHVKTRVRAPTAEGYAIVINKHVIDEIGHHRLSKLEARHVQKLLDDKAAELSPRSVGKIRDTLRIALNWAVRTERVSRNVASMVDPPRNQRSERPAPSPAEVKALIEAIPDSSSGALFALAAATGARRGELRALQWGDVDTDDWRMRITGSIQRVKGRGLVRFEPKTEGSRRTVQLPELAVRVLRRQRARQAAERLRAGGEWRGPKPSSPEGLVFSTSVGTPLQTSTLYRALHKIFDDAGVERPPRGGFHMLRHSWASMQGAGGTPIRVAMDQGGWSTVSTFIEIYGHAYDEDRQRAASVVDAAIGGDDDCLK